MTSGIVSRGLQKVRKLLGEHESTGMLSDKQLALIREQLKECAVGLGGEVSARQRAARLADTYLSLNDSGRAAFLHIVATEFCPDPKTIDEGPQR